MPRGPGLVEVSRRDSVQQAFDSFGKTLGLEKRSGSWYGGGENTITVSSLQRSDDGPSYYVNQAFWLKQLGDERYPKEWRCHVRARLSSIVSSDVESTVARLLDLDSEMPDEHREAELLDLLLTHLRPVINRGRSIDGLREMIADGTLRGVAIRGPAQPILGADPGSSQESLLG